LEIGVNVEHKFAIINYMSERYGPPETNDTITPASGVNKTAEQQRLRVPTLLDKILHDWLGVETKSSKLTALDQRLAGMQNHKDTITAFMASDSHPLDGPKIDEINERMAQIRAEIAELEQKA
jgi:hypothetical protein